MMRLFLSFLFVMAAVAADAQQMDISYIRTTDNWYYIYDESGRKINTLSKSSIGDIKGWGRDFFVSKRGGFYIICDAKGRTLHTLGATSVGEVLAVSGSTFTSRQGGWIYTWDREGKKVQTRPVK